MNILDSDIRKPCLYDIPFTTADTLSRDSDDFGIFVEHYTVKKVLYAVQLIISTSNLYQRLC